MSEFSSDELKRLLSYMDKIKSFEKINIIQTNNFRLLIFGFFFFIAGISETFLNISFGAVVTIIIWPTVYLSMILIGHFARNQMLLGREYLDKVRRGNQFIFFVVLMTFLSIITYVLNAIEFVWPFLGIYLAWYFYENERWMDRYTDILQRNIRRAIPLMGLITTIINSLGLLMFTYLVEFQEFVKELPSLSGSEPHFLDFMSLIFSVIFGFSIIIVAIVNKRSLDKYFISIEEVDFLN